MPTLSFNWLWAGLMVPLLCVCLSGGSFLFAVLFSVWLVRPRFEGALSRRWVVTLVASSLLQFAALVAVNIAAAWSLPLRAWAFGGLDGQSALAVGPFLVKGVLGVREWRGTTRAAPATDSHTSDDEGSDDFWQLSIVASTVVPPLVLLVYVLTCSRWLCRQRSATLPSSRHRPMRSGTHTPLSHDSISEPRLGGDGDDEAAPLLSADAAAPTASARGSSTARPPLLAHRRTSASHSRWRRAYGLWCLSVLALCAWLSFATPTPFEARPDRAPLHALLLDLPLELTALVSWWCLCRAVPRALRQPPLGSLSSLPDDPAQTVTRTLSVCAWLMAVPAMTLAALRNAYLRDALVDLCPSSAALEAAIGVSDVLGWRVLWRVHGQFLLALLAAALHTRWRQGCVAALPASVPLSATTSFAPSSDRASLASAAPALRSMARLPPPPPEASGSTGPSMATPERAPRPRAPPPPAPAPAPAVRSGSEDGTSLSRAESVEAAGGHSPVPRRVRPGPAPGTARRSRTAAHTDLVEASALSCARPRLSWQWLCYVWFPAQAVLLPSVASAVAALAYVETLGHGTSSSTTRRATTLALLESPLRERSSTRARMRLTRVLLAVALLMQLSVLSVFPWMPDMMRDAVWTAEWWQPSPAAACQRAQHGVLLLVFCVLVYTNPDDDAPDTAGVDARPVEMGEMHAGTARVPATGSATEVPQASRAVEAEAVRVLGPDRYRALLAFAQRANALTSGPRTDDTADVHARLDDAFVAWLGRPATAREHVRLLRPLARTHITRTATAGTCLSVEAFVRARVAAAATLEGPWWTRVTMLPAALRALFWRVAPTLLVTIVLALAAALCEAHTHLMSVLLAASALLVHATGWLNYGDGTGHRAARVLLVLCAMSLYTCVGFSYATLLYAQNDQDADGDNTGMPTSRAVCTWLQLVGLWPLRRAWADVSPLLLALLALPLVHHLGQHAGALTTWHDVLDRVEWQRATADDDRDDQASAFPSAPVACQRVLQVAAGLALSVWLSTAPRFAAAASSELLWCGWGMLAIAAAAGAGRWTSACVRAFVGLCVVSTTLAVTVAQLPLLQDRLLAWLAASTPHCAQPATSEWAEASPLSPPWMCLRELGLYFFASAPPPSACERPTPPSVPHRTTWQLAPFLLPWYVLCVTASWLRVPARRTHAQRFAIVDDASACPLDVPVLSLLTRLTTRARTVVEAWGWRVLRSVRTVLLWLGLSVASTTLSTGGALRLPYTTLLLFDAAPVYTAVYSLAYMLTLCVYQWPWVPAIRAHVDVPAAWWQRRAWSTAAVDGHRVDVADLLGLHKAPVPTSSLSLVCCPLLVLLASLPALCAARAATVSGPPSSPPLARAREEKGWLHFIVSPAFFAMIGYELLMLSLIVLLRLLQSHALGLLVLVCVLVLWHHGRDVQALAPRVAHYLLALTATVCLSAAAAALLRAAVVHPDEKEDATSFGETSPESWPDWWGLASLTSSPRALMAAVACVVVCAHGVVRVEPLLEEARRARLDALHGSANLLSHIRRALPEALSMATASPSATATTNFNAHGAAQPALVSSEDIDRVYLPALPPAAFHCVVPAMDMQSAAAQTHTARLSRVLIYALGYTAPFALLTFVAGAVGHPSLLHVLLMVTALLEVTYMEAIQWRAFRWWRTLSNAYLVVLLALPVVVHIPFVVSVLRQHDGVFTVLGLLEPTFLPSSALPASRVRVSVPVRVSRWSAATVFAVCVQGRALADVWCTSYLHRLYRSYGKRRARYEELQARLARENEAEVAATLQYDAALRQRLAQMRQYDHRHEPLSAAPLDEDAGADSLLWTSPCSPTRAQWPLPSVAHTRLPWFNRWALSLITRLAPHTYRPEKVRVDPAVLATPGNHTEYLFWRLFVAVYRVAESHTLVLVVLTSLANCLFTGALFELCGLAYLLVVVLPWYPYPPQVVYQWYFLYVTAGIMLKAAVSLLAARLLLPEGLLNGLSWMLVQVARSPTNMTSATAAVAEAATGYTRTVKYAFVVMDFLEFSALTVHHYASVWNGVYRAQTVEEHGGLATVPSHLVDLQNTADRRAATANDDNLDVRSDMHDEGMEEAYQDESEEREQEEEDEEDETWSPEQALYASMGDWMHARVLQLRAYWLRMATTVAMGTDVYTTYTSLDALALLFVTFAYTSIASSEHTTMQDNVRNNMVPGTLVLIIAASTLHLVVERMLYVRRAMRAKVLLVVLTTLVYCGVYCWWRHTTITSHSGSEAALADVGDRTRLAQTLSGLYFVLKMGASAASAIQIRKGFPRRRPHDCFTGHPESLTLYALHTCFRAIPFLWECRALIDWTMVDTSLSLDSFLKVEDVYDTVYLRRVKLAALMTHPVPIGTRVPWRTKWLTGLTRLALLLAALLAPLVYYSTLNPAVRANPVTQLEVSFSFNGARPFYSSLVQSPDNSTLMDTTWRRYVALTRPSLASYGTLLPVSNAVQRLEMTECSEELWLISPTALKRFEEALEEAANSTHTRLSPSFSSSSTSSSAARGLVATHTAGDDTPRARRLGGPAAAPVSIVQTLQLSRGSADASGSSTSAVSWTTRWELPAESARALLEVIQTKTRPAVPSSSLTANRTTVQLPFFYTPFLFNRDTSVSAYMPDEQSQLYRNRLNCTLQLRVEHEEDAAPQVTTSSTVRYWCLSCEPLFTSGDAPVSDDVAYPEWACLNGSRPCTGAFNFEDAARGTLQNESWQRHQDPALWLPLRYVTISPSVVVKLPFLNSLGIIAVYTTFVFALGRLMRSLFSAKAKSVIQTDMANPAPVSQLLECIYIARECAELGLEEMAYLELIDLLRSPERLLAVTGRVEALHQQLTNMSQLSPTAAVLEGADAVPEAAKPPTR